jgi:hypothetical protein
VSADLVGPRHVCVPRPGEDWCFICGSTLVGHRHGHEPVTQTYGAETTETAWVECRRCCTDWPCKAVKAISHNAKVARETRAAERSA